MLNLNVRTPYNTRPQFGNKYANELKKMTNEALLAEEKRINETGQAVADEFKGLGDTYVQKGEAIVEEKLGRYNADFDLVDPNEKKFDF